MTQIACVKTDRLWDVGLGNEIWTVPEMGHLRGCERCRRRFAEVIRVKNQPLQDNDPLTQVLGGLVSFLAVQKVVRRAGTVQGTTTLPDAYREVIQFQGDPGLSGTLLARNGKVWLDLAHAVLPPGTLFRVQFGEGAANWVRFILLRPGFSDPVARLVVEDGLTETPMDLRVDLVTRATALTAGDATTLRESFTAMLRDDPAALPVWRQWATEARQQGDLPNDLRSVLEELLAPVQRPSGGGRLCSPRLQACSSSVLLPLHGL